VILAGGRQVIAGAALLFSLALSPQRALATDQAVPFDTTCTRTEPLRPLAAAIKPRLMSFTLSPFPYDGAIPGENKPFLDYEKDGHRGHTSPRGNLHLEDQVYSDKHSLLYLPKGFDLSRPALIIVFLHGNYTKLMRDVVGRQRVPQQLAQSGLNAALIAPQFATDLPDSSAGWFWQPGVFKRYLAEAAQHLAELRGDPCTKAKFNELGVVIVAYSGGYNPAAYALDVGGADDRVRGVVLLDALYGEADKFQKWIETRGPAFFFSAYSDSSRAENTSLRASLTVPTTEIKSTARLHLTKDTVAFLDAGRGIAHKDFVTNAWVTNPLRAVLSAIDGYRIAPSRNKH
jgi:hypothetical protein